VLAELDACGADQDRFTRLDSDFHLALARCSRNPLMLHIYQEINDVRTHAQWDRMKTVILNPETIALYNDQHRAILHSIASRDVAGAVSAITRHLETARQHLIGAETTE
jgi:DNA-binding FadR family transcriptional regulator